MSNTQRQILQQRGEACRFPGIVLGSKYFKGEDQWALLFDASRDLTPGDLHQIEVQLDREEHHRRLYIAPAQPEPAHDPEREAELDAEDETRLQRELETERTEAARDAGPATFGQLRKLIELQSRTIELLEAQERRVAK